MTTRYTKLGLFTLFLCATLGATLTAAALDVPLTYGDKPSAEKEVRPYGSVSPRLSLTPPEGSWTLPELCGKEPLFALWNLQDSPRLLIFDRKDSKERFYSRLHFDANGNGDLTDDPVMVVECFENKKFVLLFFERVHATILENRTPTPYCFSIVFQGFAWEEQQQTNLTPENLSRFMRFDIHPSAFYRGEFELEGTKYRVMLGDTNCNGRFNDLLSVGTSADSRELNVAGDVLYLTRGFFFDGGQFTLGQKLVLNGKLFDVTVDIPAKSLRLTPDSGPVFSLEPGMETSWLSLAGKKGSVMVYESGKEIMLPPDEYRMVDYATLRKDSKGGWWMLNAKGSADGPVVTVKEGGQAALAFGEPFVPWVDVPAWSRKQFGKENPEVQLSLRIEGTGKEFVRNVIHVGGPGNAIPLSSAAPSRPKEPSYKVAKPDGEVVSQGKFEYG